jgi:flagellar motor switch/type III secretory pathway protein FliN
MTDKKPPVPEEADADEVTEIKVPDVSAPATAAPAPAPAPQAPPKAVVVEEHKPEELLANIKAPLVVELGRVNLNVMSVGDLKTNSIIELARAPGDPVDLVIGGKSIGKGELVEVEGELGVRIISLIK